MSKTIRQPPPDFGGEKIERFCKGNLTPHDGTPCLQGGRGFICALENIDSETRAVFAANQINAAAERWAERIIRRAERAEKRLAEAEGCIGEIESMLKSGKSYRWTHPNKSPLEAVSIAADTISLYRKGDFRDS